ncbi:MAG: DHH family phosphoesterase [Ruminococcus sp.]|nr:DHH family phosphoesterase [Candidatus Apopatosoma intestinale]
MPENNRPGRSGFPIGAFLCAVFGVIALAFCVIVLSTEAVAHPAEMILWVLGIYLGLVAVIAITGLVRRSRGHLTEIKGSVFGTITLSFIQQLQMPVLICDEKGKIVWYNAALSSRFRTRGVLYGKPIDTICDATIERVMKADSEDGVEVSFLAEASSSAERDIFRAKGTRVTSKGAAYCMILFEEITELKSLSSRLADEDVVVAYAMIDNIDELMQVVQDVDNNAETSVYALLKRDMDAVGGLVKEYSRHKFVCFFEAKYLTQFEKERFSILDDIREISIGNSSIPVTMSMGIAKMNGSLAEKERATQAALDMALQRGGDQVVVKTADGFDFYGGKTKTVQKRTKVRARMIAGQLTTLMSAGSNIIVMGHRYADFDAFASALAIVQLATHCGIKANVVVDRGDRNLAGCFRMVAKNPGFRDLFVDKNEAQDLIRSDTLAIMVDVNNIDYCEAPDVIRTAKAFAVIDHHRKTAEYAVPPVIAYIEPSASSASELVSELLEQVLPQGSLPKELADLLFAGILLDTKQFSHNTGVRTFGSALYLRGEGASPLDAQALFKTGIEDFLAEARFESNVVVHRSVIAIAFNNDAGSSRLSRVNAAKAADRLLQVEGVLAAFAICKIGDSVHISARSEHSVNVQLILEKMGGGGHFDAAGAQLQNVSIQEALAQLRSCIDEYLDANM